MQKYFKKARNNLSNPLKKVTSFLPLVYLAIVGFVGLKLYNVFIKPSISQKAQEKDEKIAVKNYTSRESSESNVVDTLTSDLKNQGMKVNASHISQANLLHSLLDSPWVDYDKIVKMIRGMSRQTYLLVFSAYQLRELRNWDNTHNFDIDSWKDIFSDKKLYGSMKYHLEVVLKPEHLKQIHSWLILT